MMTELPGNVLLADDFPDIFCGFSMGGPGLMRLGSASAATTPWRVSGAASR